MLSLLNLILSLTAIGIGLCSLVRTSRARKRLRQRYLEMTGGSWDGE